MGIPRSFAGVLVLIVVAGVLALCAYSGIVGYVASVTSFFRTQTTVEERFFSHPEFAQELASLILAEKRVTEVLEHTEKFEKWFVSSEALYDIRYTVLYTFVVSADAEQWEIEYSPEAIAVTAPRLMIREPSIDTSTIMAHAQGGWLIFNQGAKVEALKKSLSVHAKENTGKHIDRYLVEMCRSSLHRFLSGWLKRWGDPRAIVSVEFAP